MPNFAINVPALEKLLDYAASGIGSVAGPMLASWRARKEANALSIQAGGQANALQTITAAQVDARNALATKNVLLQTEMSISETISQRIQFQEEKRQGNIEAVVRQAAEELEDKVVPDEEPDHDWTARFFSEVQDVSSEEMRRLWGKILAGEVERPGSASIRTLTVLKNMTYKDAELFSSFSAFTWLIGGFRPLVYDVSNSIYNDNGINYDRLTHLESLGLIKLVDVGNLRISNLPKSLPASYFGKGFLINFPKDDGNTFNVGRTGYTSVGLELLPICEVSPIEGFTEYTRDSWTSQNLSVDLVN